MKYHSKKILTGKKLNAKPAFSLVEVVTALVILSLMCSTVLVIYNRCMASTADLELRRHAFEIARDNMETLLLKSSVRETADYGQSDKYSEINWTTTVESFYEPLTSRMWIQAICSTEYTDSQGENQKIELTHWLTDLSKQQLREMLEARQEELTAEQLVETLEEAAEYAEVDVETIEQWLDNGMEMTEDGYYIKDELDLYKKTNGSPTDEDRLRHYQTKKPEQSPEEPDQKDQPKPDEEPDTQDQQTQQDKQAPQEKQTPQVDDGVKRVGGSTLEELVEEGFPEELLKQLFEK